MSTPFFEEEVNQALEEFEKEEKSIFSIVGESLVEFLSKKQKAEKR